MAKLRLDVLLTDKGYVTGRDKAKALIMAGKVFVDGEKITKAGEQIEETAEIEVKAPVLKYVSRGGLKLEKAMQSFPIDISGKTCMDIGASTGGFTDCMLMSGAKKVYAVDVGYGQLAWKLRTDERVVNLERTNVRYLSEKEVPEKVDFISVDVSFISLSLVLPVVKVFLAENGSAVCLIKPQFEAGKDKVGKKGVVRDRAVHTEVIEKVVNIARELKFVIGGLDFSPVKGPEGNIEYLIYLKTSGEETEIFPEKVTELSHEELDKKEVL